MPAGSRPRHEPADDWAQLRLLVTSPEQNSHELLSPIVLFGQPASTRARAPVSRARTLRRRAVRFVAVGMHSLFDEPASPTADRRRLPTDEFRQAIVALKAQYPPCSLRETARICRRRFDRPGDHLTTRRLEPCALTDPAPLPALRGLRGRCG